MKTGRIIETLGGLAKEEKLKIPAGTQHGSQFRLKGKGMPRLHNTNGFILCNTIMYQNTR